VKTLVSAALLSCLFLFCTHHVFGADAKNDPSKFPIVVHVSASAYPPNELDDYNSSGRAARDEILTATIDGKHYKLLGPTSNPRVDVCCNGLINPGDYRAKLIQDEHKTSYESLQKFEFFFPDGTTRRFEVIAHFQ